MEWQRWLVNQPVWTPVQQCAVRIQHRDAGRPQTNENANRASRNFRFPTKYSFTYPLLAGGYWKGVF